MESKLKLQTARQVVTAVTNLTGIPTQIKLDFEARRKSGLCRGSL